MKPEITSKILDDVREKIAREYCAATDTEYREGDGRRSIFIDQLLAISGTTDIECPVCKGKRFSHFVKDGSSTPCNGCLGTGVIKHPWEMGVHLKNGELPEYTGCKDEKDRFSKCLAQEAQQDMLNDGWVKEVREVVE